jgi:hypothetical protein
MDHYGGGAGIAGGTGEPCPAPNQAAREKVDGDSALVVQQSKTQHSWEATGEHI